MFEILSYLNDALYDGLPYAMVCLGFVLTAKYMKMPDLTASGSFVLGAAVAATAIVNAGWNPYAALLAGALAGAAAGAITAFFYTVLGIDKLLSGILSSFGLYALNVILLTPTIAYGDKVTVLSPFESRDRLILTSGIGWHPWAIGVFFIAVFTIKAGLDWLLDSETGLALRALEDEDAGENSLKRQALSPRHYKVLALCIGNGVVAIAGGFVSFKEGAANAQRGFDVLVTGLVAFILGTQLLSGLRWLLRKCVPGLQPRLLETSGAILGGVAFFALVTLAQRLSLPSEVVQIVLVCMVALAAAQPGSGITALFSLRKKPKQPGDDMQPLRVESLSYRYPATDIDALRSLSFTVSPGQVIELRGGNGSGKTTALRLIGGFLEGASDGRIFQGETDVTGNRPWRISEIAYVDQDSRRGVVGSLTAAENLALAAMGGHTAFWRKALRRQVSDYVSDVIERGNFRQQVMDQPAHLLSGGQRQVLNLLTLLARRKRPNVVLLDEPINNLDVVNADRCGRILSSLRKDGTAFVVVSHTPIPGIRPENTVQLGESLINEEDRLSPIGGK
ncbi:MAG TPA: ATP-binding cassette domain-containing protein [Terracidiphilus sp.]|nr:ATP-binding cassette domain-containing protein [Terracidiphilus sp.]